MKVLFTPLPIQKAAKQITGIVRSSAAQHLWWHEYAQKLQPIDLRRAGNSGLKQDNMLHHRSGAKISINLHFKRNVKAVHVTRL